MNRKDKVNKAMTKSIIGNILVVVIVALLIGVYVYQVFFPQEATPNTVVNGKTYSFTAIRAENIAKNEDDGNIYISLVNDKNEVIDICVNDESKVEKLSKASKDNPVKFVGKAHALDEEYLNTMKELYAGQEIGYLYLFNLVDYDVEADVDYEYYVLPAIAFIFMLVFIYKTFSAIKKKNKAVQFFNENPTFNEREATRSIHKYVDIVNDFIIVMAGDPAIIDIKEYNSFVLTNHQKYFITTHYSLTAKDASGHKKVFNLPKLKKDKAQELLNYLNNYYK